MFLSPWLCFPKTWEHGRRAVAACLGERGWSLDDLLIQVTADLNRRQGPDLAQGWHFVCGRRSGIPLCCALFFFFLWRPIFRYYHMPTFRRLVHWWHHGWGYVVCPGCSLLGRRAKVRSCDHEAHADCCRNCPGCPLG